MREYLKTLREQSYVVIKPGYQEIAGGGNSEIQEVSATPETSKDKKSHKIHISYSARTRSADRPTHEERLLLPILSPNNASQPFFSYTKRKSAVPSTAKRTCARNSAIAVAPSKRACGISLRPMPRISIATISSRSKRASNFIATSPALPTAVPPGQARRDRPRRFSSAHQRRRRQDCSQQLLAYIAEITNPWLKKLAASIFSDPQLVARFKRAPAAKVMHHAYLGGLFEHVVGLCGLAKQIAAHYSELDVDLLLIAALLHDVGKLDELCYERAVGYTSEGQLLGHIMLELETVTKAMDAIEGFPPN